MGSHYRAFAFGVLYQALLSTALGQVPARSIKDQAALEYRQLKALEQLSENMSAMPQPQAAQWEAFLSNALDIASNEENGEAIGLSPSDASRLLEKADSQIAWQHFRRSRLHQAIVQASRNDADLRKYLQSTEVAEFRNKLLNEVGNSLQLVDDTLYNKARTNIADRFLLSAQQSVIKSLPRNLKHAVVLKPEYTSSALGIDTLVADVSQQMLGHVPSKAKILPELTVRAQGHARSIVARGCDEAERIRTALYSLKDKKGNEAALAAQLDAKIGSVLVDLKQEADARQDISWVVHFSEHAEFTKLRSDACMDWVQLIFTERLTQAIENHSLPEAEIKKEIGAMVERDPRGHFDSAISRGKFGSVERKLAQQCRQDTIKRVVTQSLESATAGQHVALQKWIDETVFESPRIRHETRKAPWNDFLDRLKKACDRVLGDYRQTLSQQQAAQYSPDLNGGDWLPTENNILSAATSGLSEQWLLQQDLWRSRPSAKEDLLSETWARLLRQAQSALEVATQAKNAQEDIVENNVVSMKADSSVSPDNWLKQYEGLVLSRWNTYERRNVPGLRDTAYRVLFEGTKDKIRGKWNELNLKLADSSNTATAKSNVNVAVQPGIEDSRQNGTDEVTEVGGKGAAGGGPAVSDRDGLGTGGEMNREGGPNEGVAGLFNPSLPPEYRTFILPVITFWALLATIAAIYLTFRLLKRNQEIEAEVVQLLKKLGPVDQQVLWLRLLVEFAETHRPRGLEKFRKFVKPTAVESRSSASS